MKYCRSLFLIFLITGILDIQCKNKADRAPEKDIVVNRVKLSESTSEDIQHTLNFLKDHRCQTQRFCKHSVYHH